MKKKEYIEIGGETFELCGTTNTVGRVMYVSWNDPEDIYHHYDRPSEIKKSIWHDWCKWATKNNGHLYIDSHNCFRFTIRGFIVVNGVTYQLWITDCHNRAWKVK